MNDICYVINDMRRRALQQELPIHPTMNKKPSVTGFTMDPHQYFEQAKKEYQQKTPALVTEQVRAQQHEADDNADSENLGSQDDSASRTDADSSINASAELAGVKADRSAYDRNLGDKIDRKIDEVTRRNRALRDTLVHLRTEAQSTPTQSVVEQALDDVSVIDDDDMRSSMAGDDMSSAPPELSVPDRVSGLESHSPAFSMPESSTRGDGDDDDLDEFEEYASDSSTQRAPSDDAGLEDECRRRVLRVPYAQLRRAEACAAPGVLWNDLSFQQRWRLVGAAFSRDVTIRRNDCLGPLGIRHNTRGLVTAVEVGSPAAEAQGQAAHSFVGSTVTRVDHRPFTPAALQKAEGFSVVVALFHPRNLQRAAYEVQTGPACPKCGRPSAANRRFCGECGAGLQPETAGRGGGGGGGGGGAVAAFSAEFIEELSAPPPQPPCVVGGFDEEMVREIEGLHEAAVRAIVERDMMAEYTRATQREVMAIPPRREDASHNKAARMAPAERRLWGRGKRLPDHPCMPRLRRCMQHRSDDPQEEVQRLRRLAQGLESGELHTDLERYALHLSAEKHALQRWLAGTARSAGATGDPRVKRLRKHTEVLAWVQAVEAPGVAFRVTQALTSEEEFAGSGLDVFVERAAGGEGAGSDGGDDGGGARLDSEDDPAGIAGVASVSEDSESTAELAGEAVRGPASSSRSATPSSVNSATGYTLPASYIASSGSNVTSGTAALKKSRTFFSMVVRR